MERLTEWNKSSHKHAYYPRCLKEPCYGRGCKIKDCLFETAVCERLADYEDTGLTPEEIKTPSEDTMINLAAQALCVEPSRLRELAKADKDGRLEVLPCKVGDMVWVIAHPWTDKLQKKPLVAYVNGMKLFPHGLYVNVLFDTIKINGTRDYGISRIGKTVFLTREEAEKALEEMEGKKDGNETSM